MTSWTTWLLGAWSALVLVTGVGAATDHQFAPDRGTSSAAALGLVATSADAAGAGGASSVGPATGSAPPVAVEAQGVALHAPLVAVGKTPDGALDVPDFGTAGWYQHSVVPGAPGAAVLAGHVDSTTGPDVFYRLNDLRPGDEVLVRHADGATSRFTVHDREVVDKEELPVHRIFDAPTRPELRLITCGGPFDTDERSYRSNVVVYAHLSDRRAPPPR